MIAIAFIESSYTGAGKQCIEWCIKNSIRPILLTKDRTQYNFIADIGDKLTVVDINTGDESEIKKWAKIQISIPYFATTDDYSVVITAKLRQSFSQNTISVSSVKLCRNKKLLREAMAKTLSEASTNHLLFDTSSPLKLRFPIVAKPTSYTGSIGVKLCNTISEIKSHISSFANYTPPGSNGETEWLLEEYISGDEYSVEIFDSVIVGFTKKYKYPLPYFVEKGHIFPAPIRNNDLNKFKEQINNIVLQLELLEGPLHMEVIVDENGIIHIVEINARLPGDCIPFLIKEAIGIDLIDLYMNYVIETKHKTNSLGRKYTENKFVGILFGVGYDQLINQISKEITIIESLKGNSQGPKKALPKLSNLDRSGYVILSSENCEALETVFCD